MIKREPDETAVVFSSNLDRSRHFYGDVLGFRVRQQSDSLQVGQFLPDLSIYLTADPDLLEDVGALMRVTNIREFHDRLDASETPELGELQETSTGQAQFSVSDPDGNCLYFLERPH